MTRKTYCGNQVLTLLAPGVVTAKNDEQKTDATRAKILQLVEKL